MCKIKILYVRKLGYDFFAVIEGRKLIATCHSIGGARTAKLKLEAKRKG